MFWWAAASGFRGLMFFCRNVLLCHCICPHVLVSSDSCGTQFFFAASCFVGLLCLWTFVWGIFRVAESFSLLLSLARKATKASIRRRWVAKEKCWLTIAKPKGLMALQPINKIFAQARRWMGTWPNSSKGLSHHSWNFPCQWLAALGPKSAQNFSHWNKRTSANFVCRASECTHSGSDSQGRKLGPEVPAQQTACGRGIGHHWWSPWCFCHSKKWAPFEAGLLEQKCFPMFESQWLGAVGAHQSNRMEQEEVSFS